MERKGDGLRMWRAANQIPAHGHSFCACSWTRSCKCLLLLLLFWCDKAHKWLMSPAGWRCLLPLRSSSDGPSPSLCVSVFVSVDGCIHKAAGSCLYDECHSLKGCETSKAKITCGYDLPARCEYLQIVCYVCMRRRVAPSLLLHHLTLSSIKIQWETQHKRNICCPALIYIFIQFYCLR